MLPIVRGEGKLSHAHIRRHGKWAMEWCRIKSIWHRLCRRFLDALCIWNSAFRSCLGHIKIQSTTSRPSADLGKWPQSIHGEYHPECARTLARNKGTDSLMAIYPWVDIADLRMFLAGFDAGEEFGRHTRTVEQKCD